MKRKKTQIRFKSKEAKRKYEAFKHMHVPGCGKSRWRKK
jgi:hypothetical protein